MGIALTVSMSESYPAFAMRRKHRNSLLVGGALGLSAALFQPSGCLIPDYCIVLEVEGNDACATAENAMMWPIGFPDDVERVLEDGGAPVGCECMNATEAQWIEDEAPEDQYPLLLILQPAAKRGLPGRPKPIRVQ